MHKCKVMKFAGFSTEADGGGIIARIQCACGHETQAIFHPFVTSYEVVQCEQCGAYIHASVNVDAKIWHELPEDKKPVGPWGYTTEGEDN